MEDRVITEEVILSFEAELVRLERSRHTVGRYLHDVRSYAAFLKGEGASAERTREFKGELVRRRYKPSSINTILASLFSFFKFMGWDGCGTQRMVIQRDAYSREDRELKMTEYEALVRAAASERDRLIMETICSTGIRVSELRFFTVEAVRGREIVVSCKRKIRRIMVPGEICRELTRYAKANGITSGAVFRGRDGGPISRKRVWAIMKSAARRARVKLTKVFPHNLRKLFARQFYAAGKDMVKLADVLGHSSIETTRIYTKSTGEEHRRILERLKLVVGPGGQGEGNLCTEAR